MPSLVVVGGQWGDEGKGKLVDCLTSQADWVVRFQGGNNAGHTLVVNGVKTKLQLVPSGILRKQAHCLIGAGVVANPKVLIDEMEGLRKAGVEVVPGRVVIDQDAHIIVDYHPAIDIAREEVLGKNKIGTTGRGIGPVYEDRAARRGVRFADLFAPAELEEVLRARVEEKNLYLKDVLKSSQKVNFNECWNNLRAYAEILKPYVGNGSLLISKAISAGQRVVFEGAQATMLDITFGTVPFVTSCNTIAGAASTGCGIGPRSLDYILGVAKAYCTRVGGGPFPTELHDKRGDTIRERGVEFGTVTGRPRRCGWFDAVAMRRAMRLNGFNSLAITKLDVLSGLPKLRICCGYLLDGNELEDVPALASELARVEPKYLEFDGWDSQIDGVRKYDQLPIQAKKFLDALSREVGCPISVVSVGPERSSILSVSKDAFLESFFGSEQ